MVATDLPIRYSNSGPVIGNADDGEALPGEGMVLRLAELKASTGALTFSGTNQDIPTLAPTGILQVSLANPKPNLRYRAEARLQLNTTADLVQSYLMTFAASVSGGAFQNVGVWQGAVGAAGVTATSQQVSFNLEATLGADLLAPVLDGSTSLQIKVMGQSSGGLIALSNQAQCWLGLFETL